MNSFPQTGISVVESLRSEVSTIRERALDTIAAIYWKPVYTYIRLKWKADPQASEDLTQDFFARSIERGFFAQYDPTKARFRTWLRVGIDRLVANARESAHRQK